jgi:hypothetical protein
MLLASATDVRTFINAPAADDALLTQLVTAASAFALGYMELPATAFQDTAYTHRYNGTGSRVLVPRIRPLISIQSVKVDERAIPAIINGSDYGYRFDEDAIYLRGYEFTRDLQNVEVMYHAGYTAVPADIKQAVVEVCAEKYQRRLRLGITSKSIGQESISYSQQDLSPNAKLVLEQYKTRFLSA